jgi:hypothetical protein
MDFIMLLIFPLTHSLTIYHNNIYVYPEKKLKYASFSAHDVCICVYIFWEIPISYVNTGVEEKNRQTLMD